MHLVQCEYGMSRLSSRTASVDEHVTAPPFHDSGDRFGVTLDERSRRSTNISSGSSSRSSRTGSPVRNSNSRSSSKRNSRDEQHGENVEDVDRFLRENGQSLDVEEEGRLGLSGYDRKTYSPTYGNNSRHGAPSGSPSLDGVADAVSLRRKVRAGALLVLSSVMYELLVFKICQKTAWTTAWLLLPIEAAMLTGLTTLAILAGKRRGIESFQNALGKHLPIIPTRSWKNILPLASLVLASGAIYILQAGYLEAAVSAAVSVSLSIVHGD